MFDYKKGFISLAAVLAISSGVNAASDYLPLASEDYDYTWSMFGVDGFAGNSQTADFNVDGTQATDDVVNDLMIYEVTDTTDSRFGVKVLDLDGAASELTEVTINIDVSNDPFEATESFRTVYLTIPSTAEEPNVMVAYKSSLEGATAEFQIDGDADTTYTIELSALNTYVDSGEPTLKTVGDSNTSLTDMSDIVDYNLNNNPQDSSSYLQGSDQDTSADMGEGSLRVYSYDASNSSWLIYDSENAVAANDFAEIELGKGYWGRLNADEDTSTTNSSTAQVSAGLVLGNGGLTSTDYSDNGLVTGWNLMSFSSDNPDITNAITGLVVKNLGDGNITIKDSSGVNSVAIDTQGIWTTAQPELMAQFINMKIESAKTRGEMPDVFDLRVFASNQKADTLVFIANKRFTLIDDDDRAFTTATTLGAQNVWGIAEKALTDYSAGDINASGIRSVYGEYALAFKPVVSGNSAAYQENNVSGAGAFKSAAIEINEDVDNLIYLNDANNTAPDVNLTSINTATAIEAQEDVAGNANAAVGSAVSIDMDNDGVDDWIVAASDTPFYLRDHTFIRVYAYDNNGTASSHTFEGATKDATVSNGNATATFVTNINAVADVSGITANNTGVFAKQVEATDVIVLASATKNHGEYMLYDNIGDLLQDTTTNDVMADGAVDEVIDLATLAGRDINSHTITLSLDTAEFLDLNSSDLALDVNQSAREVGIRFNGSTTSYSDTNLTLLNTDTDAGKLAALNAIVDEIMDYFQANDEDGYAYHDLNVSAASYPVTLTIESYSISDVDLDVNKTIGGEGWGVMNVDGTNANSADYGQLTTQTGTTRDLKFNAVITPSYPKAGPVYTLKALGYEPLSMITGTTNFTNGKVAWDYVDLTRTTRELYADQDSNLFTIDPKAGYWVYLDTANAADNDLTIALSGTLTPTVYHTFQSGEVTARNYISANFTVTVGGLTVPPTGEAPTERVWANVGGINVELTGDPSVGEYTGSINTREISPSSGSITVSVSDGEGWLLASQAVATLDITKPNVPVIDLTGGFSVDSNSTDVVNYYIFQNDIEESVMHSADPTSSSNYIGLVADGAASIDFCSSSAISFNAPIDVLTVAVDGGGTFTTGNISDVASTTYYAIEKGSNKYNHLGDGSSADLYGDPYDSSCTPGTTLTTDSGISLKSVTSLLNSKLAIAPVDGVVFTTDIPNTVYVKDASGNIAEIKFADAYFAKPFYVQFNNTVYAGTLPANEAGVATYNNSASAADLDGGEMSGSEVTGQSI